MRTLATNWTVIQLLPALDAGGAERSTLEVAAALVAAGHRSIVISAGGAWVSRLTAGGSEHILLPMERKSLYALARIAKLRSLLRQLKPDLVHARSRLPAWLARAAMWGMRPRPAFVTTVHGLNSVSAYSAVMSRADRVIAVSDTTRRHLLKHYARLDASRIRVIPRGVDGQEFCPESSMQSGWKEAFLAEFPMLRGGPWLTLPGRGTRLKGHGDAIELLARLHVEGIQARLLLLGVIEAGREDYARELRKKAGELGVLEFIAFSPTRADVREIYLASDLVLQLSTRPESFGRIVTEALSLRRPVLGYAHGGVGELLERHFPAGAVTPRQVDELCARAQLLLQEPPLIDISGIPRVENLQRLTLSVYRELLDGTAVDPAFGLAAR